MIKFFLITILTFNIYANSNIKIVNFETQDDNDIAIRIFPANGDVLLLGFACDAGNAIQELKTASSLSKDGIEVWMPDILTSYMLPRLKSSVEKINSSNISDLIDLAKKTGKKVYLIATGSDADLLLRGVAKWESKNKKALNGAILMFPRLNDGAPKLGMKPKYKKSVGSTKLPMLVFEGERTPNRWGLKNLKKALKSGGSEVYTKLIPDVRGYFFKRKDINLSEETVTMQLAGLIKASLFYLQK